MTCAPLFLVSCRRRSLGQCKLLTRFSGDADVGSTAACG
jgi:hypothetical protein